MVAGPRPCPSVPPRPSPSPPLAGSVQCCVLRAWTGRFSAGSRHRPVRLNHTGRAGNTPSRWCVLVPVTGWLTRSSAVQDVSPRRENGRLTNPVLKMNYVVMRWPESDFGSAMAKWCGFESDGMFLSSCHLFREVIRAEFCHTAVVNRICYGAILGAMQRSQLISKGAD